MTPPNLTHGIAIHVADVEWATAALSEVDCKQAVECLLRKPPSRCPEDPPLETVAEVRSGVQACSTYRGRLVADVHFHPVVAAIHAAFQDHRPLVLSPDMIWLLIAQGFANHVNAHAEELRSLILQHSDRPVLAVRRDDFVYGSPENPWPEVFDEFSRQIRGHLGESTPDLLMPTFSTTGPTERAAAELALMDAMQSFFAYEVHTLCGIPQIVLQGTTDDWRMLADRARKLSQFGLEWWTDLLAPILNEFVAASQGRADRSFWRSIYKIDGGSGGPYLTGWIIAFFPYLKNRESGHATQRNGWLTSDDDGLRDLLHPSKRAGGPRFCFGPRTEMIPAGLSAVPFVWRFVGMSYEMEFLGGFVGVRQEAETLRLRPQIGWAIREG